MTSPQLPTLLLVPGAFHAATYFDEFVPYLERLGYSVTVTSHPSFNPPEGTTHTPDTDTEYLRTTHLIPLIEDEGKDVVILVHSYGGIVAGAAAAGYSKTTRAKEGKKGGVLGLVYISANIIKEGEYMLQALGGVLPPTLKADSPRTGLCQNTNDPIGMFYQDASAPAAAAAAATTGPHAMACFQLPVPAMAWAEPAFASRLAYVKCLDDNTLPLAVQEAWIEASGVQWDVREIKSGHCPFISQPQKTADLAHELVTGWVKTA